MKTQAQLKELANELTDFKSCECSCKTCQGLCEMVPCMATPQEIKALIDAGHIDDLAPTIHWAALKFGLPPVECVMIVEREGGGCSMLKDGKCTLHDKGLKPSEGRFATCKDDTASFPHICAMWLLEENAPLVEWIMAQFPKLEPLTDEDKSFYTRLSDGVNMELVKNPDTDMRVMGRAITQVIQDYETKKMMRKLMRDVASGAVKIEVVLENTNAA